MKNNIFWISSLVVISVLMSGCGASKSQQMAKDNLNKMNKRMQSSNNIQNSAPSISVLKPYAISTRSKYFYNLIYLHDKNSDLIITKHVDPADNKDAKKIADEKFFESKWHLNKAMKIQDMSKKKYVNLLLKAKKKIYKPFWLLENLPEDAEYGVIYQNDNIVSAYVNLRMGKLISIKFKPSKNQSLNTLVGSLVGDLDEFLSHDKGWKKKGDVNKITTKNAIQDWSNILAQQRQELSEIDNFKEPYILQRKKQLKEKIIMSENRITYYKKSAQDMEHKQYGDMITYQYTWRGKYGLDIYQVIVYKKTTYINVIISKYINEELQNK